VDCRAGDDAVGFAEATGVAPNVNGDASADSRGDRHL